MADLEDAGYLMQPHTSAGRVPSGRLRRQHRLPGRITKADERMITRALAESDTPEEVMLNASYLLSMISNNVGIVIAPPLAAIQLKHIEFVELSDGKILVIFVSKSGLLQKKVIRAQDLYPQEELDRAGRFLVERFIGKTLPQIRNELLQMMEAERLLYDRMLNLLQAWNDTLEAESEPAADSVYVQGASNDHQPNLRISNDAGLFACSRRRDAGKIRTNALRAAPKASRSPSAPNPRSPCAILQ
jgi:heat-inducible transcriptional repressor